MSSLSFRALYLLCVYALTISGITVAASANNNLDERSPVDSNLHRLFSRQGACTAGEKLCQQIGNLSRCCPITSNCVFSNGVLEGCCPIGKICNGPPTGTPSRTTIIRTTTDWTTSELPTITVAPPPRTFTYTYTVTWYYYRYFFYYWAQSASSTVTSTQTFYTQAFTITAGNEASASQLLSSITAANPYTPPAAATSLAEWTPTPTSTSSTAEKTSLASTSSPLTSAKTTSVLGPTVTTPANVSVTSPNVPSFTGAASKTEAGYLGYISVSVWILLASFLPFLA